MMLNHILCLDLGICLCVAQYSKIKEIFVTRKRFSEKPVVAFTNSTVFILHVDFCIYMTKPVWSHVLALSAL